MDDTVTAHSKTQVTSHKPNERNQGKQVHPVLKYRVPHGSQSLHGWAPDPPMLGIRSPIGLVVGSCTSHPGVLGSIPKREEPGKTGRKVETPLVGMRMGAEHEDRQIMKSLRKCLVESESGLFL